MLQICSDMLQCAQSTFTVLCCYRDFCLASLGGVVCLWVCKEISSNTRFDLCSPAKYNEACVTWPAPVTKNGYTYGLVFCSCFQISLPLTPHTHTHTQDMHPFTVSLNNGDTVMLIDWHLLFPCLSYLLFLSLFSPHGLMYHSVKLIHSHTLAHRAMR